MATIRRLSDRDIKDIFANILGVADAPQLPPQLQYKVVPVAPGLKLSPQPYEYPEGLYILLKPRTKKRSGVPVPLHLQPFLMDENNMPNADTPWSLSGPQFPQPTTLQQRYVYPKGAAEYSQRIGAAMWTMYGADGKENLEFRLLHVYFSAKRALMSKASKRVPDTLLSARRPAKMLKIATFVKSDRQGSFSSDEPDLVSSLNDVVPFSPFLDFDSKEPRFSFDMGTSLPPLSQSRYSFSTADEETLAMEPLFRSRSLKQPPSDVDSFVQLLTCRQERILQILQINDDGGRLCASLFANWATQVAVKPLGDVTPHLACFQNQPSDACSVAFTQTLDDSHSMVKSHILQIQDDCVQGQCVSLLVSWARHAASNQGNCLTGFEVV